MKNFKSNYIVGDKNAEILEKDAFDAKNKQKAQVEKRK